MACPMLELQRAELLIATTLGGLFLGDTDQVNELETS